MFFEEFSDEKLVQAFVVVFIANLAVTWILIRQLSAKKTAIKYLSLTNVPLLFLSGAYIGTYYSHGIDVPWLFNGFIVSIPCLAIGIVTIGMVPKKWFKT